MDAYKKAISFCIELLALPLHRGSRPLAMPLRFEEMAKARLLIGAPKRISGSHPQDPVLRSESIAGNLEEPESVEVHMALLHQSGVSLLASQKRSLQEDLRRLP